MADSSGSSLPDFIAENQAQKEVTANGIFDAGSPAILFGRRVSTSGLLTWGFYGGELLVDGVLTAINIGGRGCRGGLRGGRGARRPEKHGYCEPRRPAPPQCAQVSSAAAELAGSRSSVPVQGPMAGRPLLRR